jgi:DNA repair photolyase
VNTPEFNRYETANLKIDEDRVLTYSNITCPLECAYCFANEIIRGHENEQGIYLSEEQFGLLEQLPPDIKTIMLGCDTEFLQDKAQAIDVLKRLSTMGKDISVITKLPLNEEFVGQLTEIAGDLKANNNFTTFSVSLACTESKDKWEPRTPSIQSRVDTLRRVANAGIDTMVAIRPLIPNVSENELDTIVDLTKDYAFGYYSGPMYLKELSDKTITAEELKTLDCIVSEEVEDVHWMPEGNRFLKIESPALMSYSKNKVEQSGRVFFEGAADGMEYLREHKYAKH